MPRPGTFRSRIEEALKPHNRSRAVPGAFLVWGLAWSIYYVLVWSDWLMGPGAHSYDIRWSRQTRRKQSVNTASSAKLEDEKPHTTWNGWMTCAETVQGPTERDAERPPYIVDRSDWYVAADGSWAGTLTDRCSVWLSAASPMYSVGPAYTARRLVFPECPSSSQTLAVNVRALTLSIVHWGTDVPDDVKAAKEAPAGVECASTVGRAASIARSSRWPTLSTVLSAELWCRSGRVPQ
ncbi:hypothetical protein DOTSEDRAFT_77734 [Dothistroma septosporum NZE10]|uniref:Uncharacterized protein n=1 Tax=Dothistroma septosporum (strain NZE10 / CBS 128990) TaxID=675120 RepID=N1PVL7_DOTSN|nr:hypothetical protein DOTSEDRAFT_77734 [Dothistroma septosporum NZE10]